MKKRIIIVIFIAIAFIIIFINSVNINKNAVIKITDKDNNEVVLINNQHYSNSITIEEINPKHIEYIIAIEDKRFYSHSGFDIYRIFTSAIKNITSNSTMGASTITQQYIKNTYLNNSKNIFRKIKEIMLAIKLEKILSKDEILCRYLSSIYFGNNVYGLKNAAKYYYNKHIIELSDNEMMSLIALWNSPSIYSNSLEKWDKKKDKYAKYLYEEKLIDEDKYEELCKDINLNINSKFIPSSRLFYIDQVMNEIKDIGANSGFNKEIIINTLYDKNLENINTNYNSSFASIVYDNDGYIVNCIGNNDYYKSEFNIAIDGIRDIGSTIKPILYYEALKCGFENKKYISSPYTFLYNDEAILVKNNSGKYYNNIDIKTALAVSDNVYAMKTHLALGMNTLAIHLKKYGIESNPIPSLALGSVGMSLKKLCDIYSQFFTDGKYITSKFIKSAYINDLNHIYEPKSKVLNNKEICKEIDELLKTPFDSSIKYSTCGNISKMINVDCHGKTGTTDFDSYIIGYTDKYLIGIWAGNQNNEEINSLQKSIPKSIFVSIINELYKEQNE